MNYNLASCKTVLAKIFTDLDIANETHKIGDIVEWVGEAMSHIGAPNQLITKVTGLDGLELLPITNYKTALPCDFVRQNQILVSINASGPFYTVKSSTSPFDFVNSNNLTPTYTASSSTNQNLVTASSTEGINTVLLVQDLYDLSYEDALAKMNAEPDLIATLGSYFDLNSTSSFQVSSNDIVVSFDEGYIKTNVETGYVMMAYQAYPVDEEGFPMIPDDISFREAAFWYVNMKMLYPKWRNGKIRDAIYLDAREQWGAYCNQAFGKSMMPDAGEMETIKAIWNRLIPEINHYDSLFRDINKTQILKF